MAEERAGQVERGVRAPLETRYNKVPHPAGACLFMAEERVGQVERGVRAPLATRYNKVPCPAGGAPFYGREKGGPSGERRPCSPGNPLQQSPASRGGAFLWPRKGRAKWREASVLPWQPTTTKSP
ncbi:hypothetical protein NDU88_004907 [Pleurodeles waltl]|uniref:Uncharacterized protein n=1 Tax=Pleurodeles waltl TaxID=8319 RepID=A0AAV7WY10_PLEWA|nr:hypothetical protein NDU88_004907 [Pleurodeles waltl]